MTRNDDNWVEAIGKPTYETLVEMVEKLQLAKTDEEIEEAEATIHRDPLSVEVRTGWYSPGSTDNQPTEYQILLGFGGPATQIVGDLDDNGEPQTARLEVQDWFKPWTEFTDTDEQVLLTYVRQFYFGG